MHRWGPSWPAGVTPASVRWQTNATLVIASYHASLAWLSTVPGGVMDVVVYHKHDFSKPNAAPMTPQDVLSHLAHREECARQRSLHYPALPPKCPEGCVCGRRERLARSVLQFFAVLPNYGRTHREPFGGSREPYAYLQFILDFYDNLPPVVIFTQDDSMKRGTVWGLNLPDLPRRLEHWEKHWGPGKPPGQSNCLCRYMRETNYRQRGYFWWRWMSFAEERLMSVTLANRSAVVAWPGDATFAVGGSHIRAQPRWLYELMLRLTTVENACGTSGTILWAHSLERLWFEIFDSKVPKLYREIVGGDIRGRCFGGARRRRR